MNDHIADRQRAVARRVKAQRKQIHQLQRCLDLARNQAESYRLQLQNLQRSTFIDNSTNKNDIGGELGFMFGVLVTGAIFGWVL